MATLYAHICPHMLCVWNQTIATLYTHVCLHVLVFETKPWQHYMPMFVCMCLYLEPNHGNTICLCLSTCACVYFVPLDYPVDYLLALDLLI